MHPSRAPLASLGGRGNEAGRRPEFMRLTEPLRIAASGAAVAAAPALAQTPPTAHAWQRYANAREVQLRDVAAIVRVVPENRTDIALAIVNDGPLRDPEVRVRGERLTIDGKL